MEYLYGPSGRRAAQKASQRPRRRGTEGSRNPLLQLLLVQNKDFDLFSKFNGNLLRNFKRGLEGWGRVIIIMSAF